MIDQPETLPDEDSKNRTLGYCEIEEEPPQIEPVTSNNQDVENKFPAKSLPEKCIEKVQDIRKLIKAEIDDDPDSPN